MLQKIVIMVCMVMLSVQDIRKKKVSLWIIGALAAAGVIFLLAETAGISDAAGRMVFMDAWEGRGPELIWRHFLPGIFPGVLLWLAGKCMKNQIGSGDGLTIAALGIHIGIWKSISCLMYGSVFCALTALLLLLLRKKKRKDTLPFLPFLTLGCLAVLPG